MGKRNAKKLSHWVKAACSDLLSWVCLSIVFVEWEVRALNMNSLQKT